MNRNGSVKCKYKSRGPTLRQQRLGIEPSTVEAVKVVEKAGANGITIHLREIRRHIQAH